MTARRAARAALALALVALAVAALHTAPAQAQTTPTPSVNANQLRLTDQSTWVGDNGTFKVGLGVTTAEPATAQLQMSVFAALTSRSDFTETLSDRIHTRTLRVFEPVKLSSLGAAPEMSVAVNPKASAHPAASVHLPASGVYPVRIDLFDADGNLLTRLTTHILYSGADTVNITRLDVAWVAPFHAAPPVAGSNGQTAAGSSGPSSGLSSDDLAGLANFSGQLAAHQDMAVTVAATPQTVEGLTGGTATERATAAQLAQALSAGSREVVARPYVNLDLTSMLAAGLDSEIGAQLSTGAGVLAGDLHAVSTSGTWITTGALSAAAVDDLAGRGVQRIVTTDKSLSPLPSEDRIRTLAQPFTIMGKTSRVAGLAADAGLAAHFDATPDELLAAHQLLADLAMIQLELPNRRGGRGVVIVPPTGWQPDASFLATFLDGLGSAPMLAPVTVDGLFSDVTPLQAGAGTLVRTVAPADQQPRSPAIGDATAIRAVRRTLASLSAVVPAGTPAISEVDRDILISESADLADRARAAELAAATKLIEHLKAMVRLPGNESITFTARQGLIPITVLSSAPYPVRVRLRVTSQKLGFRPVGLPGGDCTQAETTEICILDLRAENTTVRVPVVARTAGVFSLTVALDSPDGALNLATNQDTVRSTAASGVGVVLSIGAALLLAVWWVRNVLHGRRARRLVPKASFDGPPGWADREASPGRSGSGGIGRSPPPLVPAGRRGSAGPSGAAGASGASGAAGGSALEVLPDGGIPGEREDWLLASFGLDVAPSRSTVAVAPRARARHDEDITQPIPIVPVELPGAAPQPAISSPRPAAPVPRPSTPAPTSGSFSRNAAVMASGTLLSRLTGFGRVLALIWAFGIASGVTDVYNVANTAPNIIYDLVLGGILSATLVPVFVDYLNHDDPEEGRRAISAVVTAITVTLIAVSAVFWLLSPAIIRFYLVLNHSTNAADQRALGTALLHMFVPQLFLLGGIAVTTALLNARRHFAAPAFSPVINNLVVIGAIVVARLAASSLTLPGFRHDKSALLILGLGTTAGYLFQFLVQLPPMLRAGFRLRPVWDFRHPAVRTVLRLSLWTFGSVIANQISFNFILVLAEPRKGDVTVFTTAYQFFQLPYAIFAVSIATVITPDLSEHWAKRDLPGFRRQMAAGLRLTMAVLIPAAVGYAVLAQPFLHLVLRHGSLSAADAHRIATVVVLFAIGLPGFSAYLLLMRAYQAMQDTRSMFWLYLIENIATIILAGALYPAFGVEGLAIGWVGAYSIGSVAAFAHLRRRTGGLDGQAIVAGLVRVVVATALMILPVLALTQLLKGTSDPVLLARVGGGVVAGAVVYLAAAHIFGITELTSALRSRRHR